MLKSNVKTNIFYSLVDLIIVYSVGGSGHTQWQLNWKHKGLQGSLQNPTICGLTSLETWRSNNGRDFSSCNIRFASPIWTVMDITTGVQDVINISNADNAV